MLNRNALDNREMQAICRKQQYPQELVKFKRNETNSILGERNEFSHFYNPITRVLHKYDIRSSAIRLLLDKQT